MNDVPIIITADELRNILDVSNSAKDKVFVERSIRDAQNADIVTLLNFDFYSEIINNLTDPDIVELLDGGQYSYNSKSYFNPGLKLVVGYYAYAKYVMYHSSKDTPFGIVTKNLQESEHTSTARLKEIVKTHQQVAFEYWRQVEIYLNRNLSRYPLWAQQCRGKGGSGSSFKIRKIEKY